MIDTNTSTVLVALIVSVIAPTILFALQSIARIKEKREEWKRQDEVDKQAVERDAKLELLQKTADGTRVILYNQRTVLLPMYADLRERIARDNPKDEEAQRAAKQARALADSFEADVVTP